MSRIKRDILRCNFPTKVKFMGLTEKKVMYLTDTFKINFNNGKSFYLSPLNTDNIETIMKFDQQIQGTAARVSNWDKLCILGVYIKMQPIKNMFQGGAGDQISTVTCTYTMNNVEVAPQGVFSASQFDDFNKKNKQVFTFNSNEAFTIYVPAPTTMEMNSSVDHSVLL